MSDVGRWLGEGVHWLGETVKWLNDNAGVVAAVGVLLVWIVYRRAARDQRSGVLAALRTELELHRLWVGTAYVRGVTPAWWDRHYDRIVFKLSTVAVDTAIAIGPSLFLNRQLLTALVNYRQTVSHLNQLIGRAEALQASAEMWRRFPNPRLIARTKELLGKVHYAGIGHSDEGRQDEGHEAAHWDFVRVDRELRREESLRLYSAVWSISGLRIPLRKHRAK
jgi:hypothetical protein